MRTPPANHKVDNEKDWQQQTDTDVKAARPQPQGVGSEIVQSECGQNEYGVRRHHPRSGVSIHPVAPTTLDVQRHKRAQQHQRNHGGPAVQHEQVSRRGLPALAGACRVLHPIGQEPSAPCAQQN